MLNNSQIATFEEEGYLVIENLFTEDDFRAVKDEFSAVVEQQARKLYQAGRISALYGDETLVVACLIPLIDTTLENGCLWVAPRRHKEGVLTHFWGEGGLNILLEDVSEAERLPMPMKAGSIVMFSSMLPYGSLANRTDTIRWSMDLRYQAIGKPTGRWYVPGFVARSCSHPELEMPNCKAWVAEVERVAQHANKYPEWPRFRWPQTS